MFKISCEKGCQTPVLKHFKSMKQMRQASVEEIATVIPENVAKILYARLHEH